jgi:pimeloyl-ACP methyl ester carboxylesterase
MTIDTGPSPGPARLDAHELVFLHGQPGSPADWQQVIGRLPAKLHAVATDRPGYGSSRVPPGGFAVNARAEHVNLQVWGHADRGNHLLWRTFLTEQRALLRELDELDRAIGSVRAPVLLLADPADTLVPVETARRLARDLPDARLQLVEGAGHQLPRRAPEVIAVAIAEFLATKVTRDRPTGRGPSPR